MNAGEKRSVKRALGHGGVEIDLDGADAGEILKFCNF